MTAKRVVPRERATRDIQAAASRYAEEASVPAALHFIDAVESAFRTISLNPAIGSPRYAHELDLPGLRTWALRNHPYLVFYVERDDHIDVWRVLHARRDIPASMGGPKSW